MPELRICPISLALFLASGAFFTYAKKQQQTNRSAAETSANKEPLPPCQVVFVLGGPGAGKGTQCALIEENFPQWVHLSAGDLLRAARKNGGPVGDVINSKIASGQLVPAEITVGLLQKAMEHSYATKKTTHFLIDGFPRNQDNVTVWQTQMPSHQVPFVLNFDCPEEVLVGRLLERGQTSGRNDDKLDVIRKRFRTFQEESTPIVENYQATGQVRTIVSDKSVEQVYQQVKELFEKL